MQEKTSKTRYFLPVILALVLALSLITGVMYMRDSLMDLTVRERSNQLKEMVSQIQANLSTGLETHWNLVTGMEKAIRGRHFSDADELMEGIKYLEDVFCADMYGSRVMLIDDQGTACLDDGPVGIWNDITHLIGDNSRHTFISETDQIEGCYLVFALGLEQPVTMGPVRERFTHVVLLKDIQTVKQYYTTTTYGGSAATYIIRENGVLAYYDAEDDDVLGARNVFKALKEVEYVHGQDFESVNDEFRREGTVAASIQLSGTEYFYCLTSLGNYDMTLMLLIPADSIATSTMDMMNTTIRTEVIFVLVVSALMVLVAVSFTSVRRSRQDVRMEQETNRELNRLRIAAESANDAKSTFLNNMSHDIRTPMNAIMGFTSIALRQNPSPEVRNCLEKINDSSQHLLMLINDVLDISRIESGKLRLSPVPTDIRNVFATVTGIVTGFLSDRSIDFVCHQDDPDKTHVLIDAVRVREVLVNILGNAVKFTEDGGRIEFSASYSAPENGRLTAVYTVSDTGVGMSEEFIDHIFDEFSQEDNSARTMYKGTGLGMAITKKYVDLMDGTIKVESTKGKGSVFTVTLPMEVTDEHEMHEKTDTVRNVNLKGLNVLLAEDNDLNAEIAVFQLEELGLNVIRAMDGSEAVKLFSENPVGTFDLILMDVMMPNMNGYEATGAIRSLAGRSDALTVPIIAMTANAFAEDVQASLAAGMNGHLSKPINPEELKQILQSCISM
ncbi:MAG: ATP-binding protein [Bullifex sp.]